VFRVKDIALESGIGTVRPRLVLDHRGRNCRQIKDLEIFVLLKVSDEVFLMDTLHDDDDAGRLFIIRAGYQS
jgi:hypothetical protein